mgnify:CR=1 FL=1
MNHVFSKRFIHEMKKIIHHEQQSPFQQKMIRYGKRAAMFILVAMAVMFTTVMSVSALRAQFFNMISDGYQKYSAIYFNPAESQISSSESGQLFERYMINYIPEGYKLTKSFSNVNLKINDMEFENSDKNRIEFHQENILTANFNVNTEGVKLQEIEVNGYKAYYYENKGMHTIVWHNDQYAFLLSADVTPTLNKNEMVKIAESIAPQK